MVLRKFVVQYASVSNLLIHEKNILFPRGALLPSYQYKQHRKLPIG